MFRTIALATVGIVAVLSATGQNPGKSPESSIAAVLDDWHNAAAAADEARYFGHFTADAVMMGTDATERWTRDQFHEWAKPHFAKGTGWKFKAVKRYIFLAKDGSVAWFDEALETEQLGPSRGSGVLVLDGGHWKIAQYNLSVPIPNDVFKEVKKIIDAAPEPKS